MIKMNYYAQNFTEVGTNTSYSVVLRKNENMFYMNVSSDVNEGSVTSLSTSGEFKVCLSRKEYKEYEDVTVAQCKFFLIFPPISKFVEKRQNFMI